MAEKLFYSMGEVAEMFDVNQSLLRHWESQFSVLRPKRNKKGNRLFSPQDVETLKLIYHLVKERGMTLDGARKALRQSRREGGVRRDAELAERLQRIRALLVEVREDLKADAGGAVVGGPAACEEDPVPQDGIPAADSGAMPAEEPLAAGGAEKPAAGARRGRKAVVKIAEEPDGAASSGEKAAPRSRRARRKKEESAHKELFAFYEQSLF